MKQDPSHPLQAGFCDAHSVYIELYLILSVYSFYTILIYFKTRRRKKWGESNSLEVVLNLA